MPHREPELKRIIDELEAFVTTTCTFDPEHPDRRRDFVSEKCNDAALMLREAHDELLKKQKERRATESTPVPPERNLPRAG